MGGILLRGVQFIGGWVLLLVVVALISDTIAPVYPEMKERRRLLRERAHEIEALSLGNSHAAALDFEVLGVDGFHMWQDGADLHSVAFLLEELSPQLPALRCVFVVLSPFGMHVDNGNSWLPPLVARRREIYVRTPSLRHIPGDMKNMVAGKFSVIVRYDHWNRVFGHSSLPASRHGVEPDGRTYSHNFDDVRPTSELQTNALQRADQQRERAARTSAAQPDVERRAHEALERAMSTAKQRGVRVVAYTPPYTRFFADAAGPALAEIETAGHALARQHAHVSYISLARDSTLTRNPAWFRDGDHLNRAGGRALSARLRETGIECDPHRRVAGHGPASVQSSP